MSKLKRARSTPEGGPRLGADNSVSLQRGTIEINVRCLEYLHRSLSVRAKIAVYGPRIKLRVRIVFEYLLEEPHTAAL